MIKISEKDLIKCLVGLELKLDYENGKPKDSYNKPIEKLLKKLNNRILKTRKEVLK